MKLSRVEISVIMSSRVGYLSLLADEVTSFLRRYGLSASLVPMLKADD